VVWKTGKPEILQNKVIPGAKNAEILSIPDD
jgi:hypothetical protein